MKLVKFQLENAKEEIYINPAYVRYIEAGPGSSGDAQAMTAVRMNSGEVVFVRGLMHDVAAKLEAENPG